jgi:hypothetical protein
MTEKNQKAFVVKFSELLKRATVLSEQTRLANVEARRLRAATRRLTAAADKMRKRLSGG